MDNIALFKQAEKQRPLLLVPGRPPLALPLDQPLMATGAVKQGQKQVGAALALELCSRYNIFQLMTSQCLALLTSTGTLPGLLRLLPCLRVARAGQADGGLPGH